MHKLQFDIDLINIYQIPMRFHINARWFLYIITFILFDYHKKKRL